MKKLLLSKLNIGIILALAVLALPLFADEEVKPLYMSGELIQKVDNTPSAEIGTRHSDMLVGTGRFSAYLLSKGNLLPRSEYVSVGLKNMKRDVDYTINYATGSVQFFSVVRAGDTIRVDYRYKGDGTPVRNIVDPTASMLKFGSDNSNVSLNFGYRTADPNAGSAAADILTYGLSTSFTLNAVTKLTGLVYSAAPESPNRVSLNLNQSNQPQMSPQTSAKKGNLLVQNLTTRFGKLGLTATYEDVDETFQGFQTMRESGNIDQNLINRLQSQRGTTRTAFSANLPTGKDAALSFSSDTLEDTTGSIKTHTLALQNAKLQMNLKTVDNSKDFNHYTDEQTKKESGIKRTYADMKFTDKFGSLAFNQTSIKDNRSQHSAGIDIKAISFATKTLSVNMSSRDIDKNFTRGLDLAEPEREVLASERGMKRDNVSVKLNTTSKSSLSFDQGTIRDNLTGVGAAIDSKSIVFATPVLNLSYATREIDKTFNRAHSLGDPDKGQIAAEVGLKRTTAALNMRTGLNMDKSPAWSSYTQSRLEDKDMHYSRQNMDLVFGKLRAQVFTQSMSPNFSRIGALNIDDRRNIALAARRAFDHNAQIGQITEDDLNRTHNERGLNRSNYAMQWDNRGYSLALSLSNITITNERSAGLNRTAMTVDSPKYNLFFNRHDIDGKFNRLGSLQPVELASYGNEYGMERTELGGKTKLFGGDVNFLQTNIDDAVNSSTLKRSTLNYSTPKLRAKINLLTVPDSFKRIGNLRDSQEDKNYYQSEAGFNRQDYWVNFQATPAINIDTYLYTASSDTRNQDKSQQKVSLAYAPKSGPRITAFSDVYESTSRNNANIYKYDHRIISFDQNVKFLGPMQVTASHDVNVVTSGSADPTETTVDKLRLHRQIGQYTKLTFELADTINSMGHYDKNRKYSVETPITKELALVGNYATRDLPDDNLDEENFVLGLRYALNSRLSVTFSTVTNSSKAAGVTRNTQISASGLVAKRLGPISDININTSLSSAQNRYTETARDDSTKLQANLLGGTLSIESTEQLNPQTGIYTPRKTTRFSSGDDPKRKYKINLAADKFKDSTGSLVEQNTADASFKLSQHSSLIFNSYKGTKKTDTPENTVIIQPIRGDKMTYSNILSTRQSLYADYSLDQNELTKRSAKTMGAGTKGALTNNANYDLYYGLARVKDHDNKKTENVYRASFDYRINSDHFLIFSAQKKSDLESATINPEEGKTVFKLDYQTVFN